MESRYSLLAYSNSPPAGSATSSDELQSAARGGGELRGSKSRRSAAHLVSDFRPILSGAGCGVRPGHRRCPAASPAALRAAKAWPGSLPQFCRFRAARSEGGPKAQRRPGGSTNRKSIIYSLSAQIPAKSTAQSSPQFSAPCPPHCGSAVAPPVPLGTRKDKHIYS